MKNQRVQLTFFAVALVFAAASALCGIAAFFFVVPRAAMLAFIIPTAVLCVIAAVSAVKNRGAYNKKILQYVDIALFFLLAAVVLWAGINHFLFADVIAGGSAVSLPDGYHLVSRGEIVANITKAQFIEISLAEIKLIMSECAAFSFIAAFLIKISANYLKRSGSPV